MTSPITSHQLGTLLRADLRTELRRRRSVLFSILIPVLILVIYQKVAKLIGAAGVIGIAELVGLLSVGLMGYALGIAQDRAAGVFQRLRVTPTPAWTLLVSRILVQLTTMLLMTVVVLVVAAPLYHLHLGVGVYLAALGVSLVAGAVYLALGQTVVGFVRTAEGVNATVRILIAALAIGGVIGSLQKLSSFWDSVITWSPFGTVQPLLIAAISGSHWTGHDWAILAANLGYILVFAGLGIRYFRWTGE